VILFSTVFDLGLKEFGVVYLPVTIASSVLLTIAYRNVSSFEVARLSTGRKAASTESVHKELKLTTEQLNDLQQQTTYEESVAWAFFFNNLLWLIVFSFLSFYVLRQFQPSYNYTVSVVMAAVFVWQWTSRSETTA